LGYALEGFDALGRSRTQERVIDSKGSVIASPAVDTTSRLQIDDDDKAISHGPMDLAKQMSTSPKARQCFERHYLRFALGRAEDTAKDGCTLAALDSVVTQGGSLRDTFRALALTSAFRQKSF
jgi:hypothetical protein